MEARPGMLSVITQVHDSANTLHRCLTEMAASDYSNYDCIVVNDGLQITHLTPLGRLRHGLSISL